MTKTAVHFGRLYLANKMAGVPFFNAIWFDKVAAQLRSLPGVDSVFNPADEDRARGFDPMKCPHGTCEEAEAAGFNLRDALLADWTHIARHSDGLIIGPEWAKSPGTISEIACHQALRLPVWESRVFIGSFLNDYDRDLMSPDWQFPALSNYLI